MPLGSVEAQRDEHFAQTLRPISIALSAAYAGFAVAHYVTLDPAVARWMVPIAAVSAVVLAALAIALGRWKPPSGYAHAMGALVAYVIAGNSVTHLALSREPGDSLNILLLILASGGLLYSLRWLLWISVPPLMAWAVIAYHAPSNDEWTRFGFILCSGAAIAIVLVVSRVRIHKRVAESDARTQSALAALRDELEHGRAVEAQLRDSEFRYRLVADNARDMIVYLGSDSRVAYASPSTREMYGIDASSLVGRTFEEVVEELRGDLPSVPLQSWPPDVDRTFELPVRLADGKEHLWEIRTGVVRDANGSFDGLHVAARDVTDRRLAEDRLELARFALDTAGEAILRLGPRGEILDANATTTAQSGFDRNELLSMTLGDLHPGFDMTEWPEFWANLSASAPALFESRQRAKNGTEVPVEVVVNRVGIHEQAIAFVRDIRTRLEAEESLRESEEKVHALFDQTVVGMLILGRDSRHRQVNPALSRMLGYEPDELVGMGLVEITPPEDREALLLRGRSALEGEVEVARLERRFLRKDGAAVWTRTTRIPVLRRGRAEYWVLIVEDITSELAAMAVLEETKHKAENAAEAKAEFLASIAHEVRTPMNAVIGMTSLLMETPLDELQRDYAQTIQSSGAALLAVVDDLLNFSRSESGKLHLEDNEFDLAAIISESVDVFANQAREKEIDLQVEIDPSAPTIVCGDAGRVRQVLTNLISNAVKFTEAGRIDVRMRTSSAVANGESFDVSSVRIEVQDTGIGIDAARCEAIFTAFEQAEASTHRLFGGTGLGLAICRNLCQAMGGNIGVESEPGVGTTFWFEIPLVRDFSLLGAGSPAFAEERTAGSSSLPVLIAEDNPVNMRVLQHMLTQLGYRSVPVANGAEAAEAAARESFAAILLDCRMPIMDGYEAAMRIRANSVAQTRRVPILAVTANASLEDRVRCLEAGMDDYLPKPISLATLGEALTRWVESKPRHEAPETPEFDLDEATIRAGGDVELVLEVAALVEEHAPRLLREVNAAAAARNWRQVALSAHSLKGQAAQMSAPRAAASAERVENIAEERDEAELEAALRELEVEVSLLLGVLGSLRTPPSASA